MIPAIDQVALAIGLADQRGDKIIRRATDEEIIREARYLYAWREAILDGLGGQEANERALAAESAWDALAALEAAGDE